MHEQGVTLLFVSHSQEDVRTLTTRALLLDAGEVRAIGPSAEVLLDYRRLLHEEERRWVERQIESYTHTKPNAKAPEETSSDNQAVAADDRSFGDLDAQVLEVKVLDVAGVPCAVFEPGDRMVLRLTVRVNRDIEHLNVAVRLRDKQGVKLYSWGTLNQDMAIWSGRASGDTFWDRRFAAGEIVTVDFECDCMLGRNFYEIQACVSEEGTPDYLNQRMLHWVDEAAFLQVTMPQCEYFFGGVADLRMEAHVRD